MNILQENNPNLNILDQISNYNFNKLEKQTFEYKTILNNQRSLNRALKTKNINEIKEDLVNFLEIKKPEIDKQLEKLMLLKQDIIAVSLENKKLEDEDLQLAEFQNSKEMKDLSIKLSNLSNIQNELNFFLEDIGIS
jgi:hypothetical protein